MASGQVVIIDRADAQFIVKTLIARHHIAGVIIAAVVFLAKDHFEQHGVVPKAIFLIVRVIYAHEAGGALVAKVKIAQANELFALVDGYFVSREDVVFFAIKQVLAQGRRKNSGEIGAISPIEVFLFGGDGSGLPTHPEEPPVAMQQFALALVKLIAFQIKPHPNGREEAFVEAQKMRRKDGLPHPIPPLFEVGIEVLG